MVCMEYDNNVKSRNCFIFFKISSLRYPYYFKSNKVFIYSVFCRYVADSSDKPFSLIIHLKVFRAYQMCIAE